MEITKETVLRAWKDEQYRSELPEEVRQQIPARPTAEDGGALSDEQLEAASGAATPAIVAAGVLIGGGSIAAGWGSAELADGGDC